MSKKINISKDFLIKEYVENGKSFNQIAKELNFAKTTIRNYCKTYNIKSKSISKYSKILTKDFLYNEYIINKKSIKQISLMVKLPITTISYNLKINKIKTRRTEGKNHPNYGNKGKYSFSFKGGQCSKKYFCLVCGKEISISSGFYGKGRCGSCASSTKSLKQWQNKEFREKTLKAIFKGLNLSPNKPETRLIKLLNKLLPKTYKFVGDGKLIVGGLCPDFVNNDNNKIIEMYGDYWHNLPKRKQVDKRRLKEYKKAGYKTLIIWEHELKNLNEVKDKILEFNIK